MKNKSLYLWTLVAGVMLLASCENFLEEIPQNKLKPSTTDDYDQLLNKAYHTSQVTPYLDILSDDVELIASNHVMEGGDYGDIYVAAYMWEDRHEQTMPSGDVAFRKFYESVFYTNVVLENIDKALGVELNEENVRLTRNNIKGEAYALRAYCYFYLVNLYAAWYDPETSAADPGVPLNLSTAAEDKAYTRHSVGEVYDRMASDLTQAVALLEENPRQKEAKLKFDAPAARALLARVYLYMQQWDKAIEQAEAVIGRNRAIFNLWEAGRNSNVMTPSPTSWTLAGTDYLAKANDNILFVNGLNEIYPALSYWSFITTFSVNRDLASRYDVDDVRRPYFMRVFYQSTYAGTRRKLSYAKNRNSSMNFSASASSGYNRVIRTEEMYLILAEAYAHKTDGIARAVEYLNTMRIVKFKEGTYVPLAAADFDRTSLLAFVMDERRRELCFEGHRWFDLRRTTRPAMQRPGYNNLEASLVQDDPRYILQIPQRELSVNSSIGPAPR